MKINRITRLLSFILFSSFCFAGFKTIQANRRLKQSNYESEKVQEIKLVKSTKDSLYYSEVGSDSIILIKVK